MRNGLDAVKILYAGCRCAMNVAVRQHDWTDRPPSAATVAGMRKVNRISVASTAVALTLLGGGLSLAASPIAAAGPSSHLNATGGDNTAVDSDGDQDAFPVINSVEARPQVKAPNKMTK